ncbi:rhodopsin [Trichoplax sp. H2]|nr:rhodopsin [Trichoplax sp. H2]|eukprot:RDD39978.1 rhodopsin [Trichoplax sp. H2]
MAFNSTFCLNTMELSDDYDANSTSTILEMPIPLIFFQCKLLADSTVGLISCFLNSFIIYVIKYKADTTIPVFFALANLAIANILLATTLSLADFITLLQYRSITLIPWVSYTVCGFLIPLAITANVVINGSLIFISIARYQKFKHSEVHGRRLANRQVILVLILLWCIGVVWAIPSAKSNVNQQSIFHLCDLLTVDRTQQSFLLISCSLIVVLPAIITTYCHYRISVHLSSTISISSMTNSTITNHLEKQNSSFHAGFQRKKDIIKMLRKLSLLQFLLNVTWLISISMTVLGNQYFHKNITSICFIIQNLAMLIAGITSPVIHINYIQRFREPLHSFFLPLRRYISRCNEADRADQTFSLRISKFQMIRLLSAIT